MFSVFDQKEIGDNLGEYYNAPMDDKVVLNKLKNVQQTLDVLQSMLNDLPKTDVVTDDIALAWNELEYIIDYLEFADE